MCSRRALVYILILHNSRHKTKQEMKPWNNHIGEKLEPDNGNVIVTKLRTGRSAIQIPTEARLFSSPKISRLAPGPDQPPVQLVLLFFPGMKNQRCDANHSPPSSTKVKKEWSTILFPYKPSWFQQRQLYLLIFVRGRFKIPLDRVLPSVIMYSSW